MAQRWTEKRRNTAATLLDEGNTPAAVAKAMGLETSMVKAFKAFLDKAAADVLAMHADTATPVPKAAPKKKATTKKKTTKKKAKAKKKKAEPLTKKQRIDQLIAGTNSALKSTVIRRADEHATDYLLRRPTGIISLDIGLGGGFPASALSVLTGPDGAGKDYILDLTMAQQQQIQGDDFACLIYSTEFKFDKRFARDMCGFEVAMTDSELEREDLSREQKGIPPLNDEEREYYQTQIGEVLLVDGVIADDGLDVVLDTVANNEFQIVAINSLGVLQTQAKENAMEAKDGGLRKHAVQSNEAQLLSRFMPNLFMVLNCEDELGRRNQTAVIAVDQVRANRNMGRTRPGMKVPEKWKYVSASGSRALKHGKAIELMLHKGSDHVDKEYTPPIILGREVEWEILKGKLGTHDGLKGTFDFWFDGGADPVEDLIRTAAFYGIVKKSGSWYSYQHGDDEDAVFSGQGARNFRVAVEEYPEVLESMRDACLSEAEIVCLYK